MTMHIDAHQHFWAPARGDYGWMDPDDPVLARNYRLADLEPHLDRHGISATVLVQAAPSVGETEYMLGIADSTHRVAGVVGWIDFEKPDHIRHLERFSGHDKFRGVRPMIQDIADDDWMLRPDLDWAFRALIDHDIAFDALGFPRHLERFLKLFNRYPDMRVIVDHCMKPQIADGAFDVWASNIARLAEETGAWCKLSGLVTEASEKWTVDELRPYADHVLDRFGPERIVWGSDWPVCTLHAEYDQWVEATHQLLAGLSDEQRTAVLGGNAVRFYRLEAVSGKEAA
ncbi:MAG TPA: amidohydrolase family protein [Afifellaceae bacterium]|nr:amidohydrolase family protein [Afifellaceae bacterium]